MILDDVEILAIEALKDAKSGMELKNPYMPIDLTRPMKRTIEDLLMWARNMKNNVHSFISSVVWYTATPSIPILELFVYVVCHIPLHNDHRWCQDQDGVEFPIFVDDHVSLPPAILNVIGTTQTMEIKSHSYYEYGTFESFTCWQFNPKEGGDDSFGSSTLDALADVQPPQLNRLVRAPSIATPSKPSEPKRTKRDLIRVLTNDVSGNTPPDGNTDWAGSLHTWMHRPISQQYDGMQAEPSISQSVSRLKGQAY
nr:hypothetical protein [Tanacetum cinerariifolium]